MISPELSTRIRHLFHAEHWKIGTIAAQLELHHDTVRRALATDRFRSNPPLRSSILDSYRDFIAGTLQRYPRLRATRLLAMLRDRGFEGSIVQLRRLVATLRPPRREAFLRLRTFPGEQAQADWAHFGEVAIGRGHRRLSCCVLTLSYSRALYLEFFFDQTLESFLLAHVHAFHDWQGCPKTILYDNLRSVVLERRGDAVRFHPRLLELCAHYHFAPQPCAVARGNEKGRVERAIQFVRHAFFAARSFTTLEDFNRQALAWRDTVAHERLCPGQDAHTVAQVFQEEKARLLPLPENPFSTDQVMSVRSGKTIYLRFDLNDYSIPPAAVGKALTLVASPTVVRILDGSAEIARHRRCYDRHATITDPIHQEALLESKRRARSSTPATRLALAVPESEAFLDAAFQCHESAGHQTAQLIGLLDEYGAIELRAAIREALDRHTPRASSVAFLLKKRQRALDRLPPLPVDLSRRPDLADLYVQPHNPETYDDLSNHSSES